MRKYQPSNGSEGDWFIEEYCMNCINECWLHNPEGGGKKCDILSRTMLFDVNDKEYPEEWTYNGHNQPICTAWIKWDWGNDGDPGDPDNPNYRPPDLDNPNQLVMPFLLQEIGIEKSEKELA